ncbi:hypothetical protein CDAR_437241, partial [Caerostris darwini]
MIRVNALAMVKIVASQNTYIAQLEGRLQEMERILTVKATSQQAPIDEAVARDQVKNLPGNKVSSTISYADKVRNGATSERIKSVNRNKVTKKFVTTVKPKEEATSSADTRKVVQTKLDIRKLKIGVKQLSNSILCFNFDFISINEPYVFDNTITAIPFHYTIVAADCGPRAALVIKSNLETQTILVTRDIVIVHLIISGSDCLLISTYCPPKGNLALNLEVIQAFLMKYPHFKTFICGDFNAKSRVWGKRNVDARGTQILAFCNAMDLTIQNSPSSLPTFDCSRGQSWIDLLLTKNLDTGISMEVTDD